MEDKVVKVIACLPKHGAQMGITKRLQLFRMWWGHEDLITDLFHVFRNRSKRTPPYGLLFMSWKYLVVVVCNGASCIATI